MVIPGAGEKSSDYRSSHVGTGLDYHEKFMRGPYRSVIWDLEQERLLEILQRYRADLSAGLKHLDFACGTGRVLKLFETLVDASTGIDVSESMLEVANANLTRSEIVQADITRDAVLTERQFELITAFRFFPNAEPQLRDEVMQELVSRLSANGVLIFNNHIRCTGSKLRLRRFLLRWFGKGRGKIFHCMSDQEVAELAERFGLKILEEHSLAFLPVLKEKRPLLPRSFLRGLERTALGRPGLAGYANMRIYVLGHQSRGLNGPDNH